MITVAGLLTLVLVLAVIGCIIWAITTYIPMPPVFKTIIYVVVAVVLIVWLINLVGGAGILNRPLTR